MAEMANKKYVTCSLVDHPDSLFQGYYGDCSVSEEILAKLSRDLGFSLELYDTLRDIDMNTADSFIVSRCKATKITEITLLVDEKNKEVLGYSLDASRAPLLNDDFMKRVTSLIETSQEIKITEKYYHPEDTTASVIIKKLAPIEIDLNSSSKASYEIGVLVVNSEVDSTYCRLVVFIDGQPIYLPASYYNTTTNRFRKSTGNSAEALEVLILKIIDELRDTDLVYKLTEFHMKYRVNKDVLTTYEEYNTLLRTMMKIPSIIDDRSFLESLNARYEDFEHKYAHLDDKKSSYIWRCTAIGDLTIGGLTHVTSTILSELGAPMVEYYAIRELLGNYLSTNRIVVEIAKEDN